MRGAESISSGQPRDHLATLSVRDRVEHDVVRVPLNEDCWVTLNGVNASFGDTNCSAR